MKPLSFLVPVWPLVPASFLAMAGAALMSCHQPPGNAYIPLTETSIYSVDSVRMAAGGGDENAATLKLEEAVRLYRKGGDTAGTIALFKSSIRLQPTAKAYYELSGVLLSARRYDEAVDALIIAEKLGYTPLANVMFRYAMAYSNKDQAEFSRTYFDSALHFMELAIQMGYPRPQLFLRKDLFPVFANFAAFDVTYNAAVNGGTGNQPDKTLWDTYQAQYPAIQLPLVIDAQWIRNNKLKNDIPYIYEKFIPAMQDNKFARADGIDFYYVALIRKDTAYTAMLYGADREEDDSSSMANLSLISYDPEGKIIDKMMIAGREDLSAPFFSCSLHADLSFEVREDTLQPVGFRIAASGKFERVAAPVALR